MSRSLNRAQLLGHLGGDADVKFTPNGTQRAAFSIATTRRWKDQATGEYKEATDWHRCILWRCENVVQFLTKGKQVYVEGRLQTRDYEDKDGVKRYVTEIVVDDLMLLGGGKPGEAGASQPAPGNARGATRGSVADQSGLGVSDDDVPF